MPSNLIRLLAIAAVCAVFGCEDGADPVAQPAPTARAKDPAPATPATPGATGAADRDATATDAARPDDAEPPAANRPSLSADDPPKQPQYSLDYYASKMQAFNLASGFLNDPKASELISGYSELVEDAQTLEYRIAQGSDDDGALAKELEAKLLEVDAAHDAVMVRIEKARSSGGGG